MIRKQTVWLAGAAALLAGCSHKVEDCQIHAPEEVRDVRLAQTPNGKSGCQGMAASGVLVSYEMKRQGLSFVRGLTWINHEAVSEADYPRRLAEAKARAEVDKAAGQIEGTVDQIKQRAKDFWNRQAGGR